MSDFFCFDVMELIHQLAKKVLDLHVAHPMARRIVLSETDSNVGGRDRVGLMVEVELSRRNTDYEYTYVLDDGLIAFEIRMKDLFLDDTDVDYPVN